MGSEMCIRDRRGRGERNVVESKKILKIDPGRKAASDCSSLTKDGREFQARAAATGNARSPRVRRRVAGTKYRKPGPVIADLLHIAYLLLLSFLLW